MKRLLIAVLSAAFFTVPAFAAKYNPVIYADAEAVIKLQPDSAVLNCGIVSKGSDFLALKKAAGETVAKVIEYCKNNGIAEKNITVEFMTIEPVSLAAAKKENTYNVEQDISIVIEDMSKYETIMSDILGLGVNRIKNVNLRVNDIEKYRTQARELATERAKAKIEELVNKSGLKIIKINNVSETNQRYMPPVKIADNSEQLTDIYIDNAQDLSRGSVFIRSNITMSCEVK